MSNDPVEKNDDILYELKSMADGKFSDEFLGKINEAQQEYSSPIDRAIKFGVLNRGVRQIAADMYFKELDGGPRYVSPDNPGNSVVSIGFRTVYGDFHVEISADGLRILITSYIRTDKVGETIGAFSRYLKEEGIYVVPEILGVDQYHHDTEYDKGHSPFSPTSSPGGPEGFKTKCGYINGELLRYDDFFAWFKTPQGILAIPIIHIENFEPGLISGKTAESTRMRSASSATAPSTRFV